jgi:hypothetical protein
MRIAAKRKSLAAGSVAPCTCNKSTRVMLALGLLQPQRGAWQKPIHRTHVHYVDQHFFEGAAHK